MTKKSNIRWAVFLIPWLLVIATIILNLVNGETFNALIMTLTSFILGNFDWLFGHADIFLDRYAYTPSII